MPLPFRPQGLKDRDHILLATVPGEERCTPAVNPRRQPGRQGTHCYAHQAL